MLVYVGGLAFVGGLCRLSFLPYFVLLHLFQPDGELLQRDVVVKGAATQQGLLKTITNLSARSGARYALCCCVWHTGVGA